MKDQLSWIKPMKALTGSFINDKNWVAEIKWDGIRSQVHCIPDLGTRIYSISGREITNQFPELHELNTQVSNPVIFDGEIVSFENGVPSLKRIQHRFQSSTPNNLDLDQYPITFMAFDILFYNGKQTVGETYSHRRELLESVLEDNKSWKVPKSNTDIQAMFDIAESKKLEGIVLKRKDSIYQPGKRSHDWIKKKIRQRQEFIICGWHEGEESLKGAVGSLILGYMRKGNITFAGIVGTGLDDYTRSNITKLLKPAESSPFKIKVSFEKKPVWVSPSQVIEVEYGTWPEGGIINHSSFKGFCIDKDPMKVIRENSN